MNFNNYAEKILNKNNNYIFIPHIRINFSNNRESHNKSSFSQYINLNKSQNYYNGNEIKNMSSFNNNNSMYIRNSKSKNKKYIVQIRLSNNNIPDFDIENNSVNNNSNKIEYSNNTIKKNSNKIISEKNRNKHYISYKNVMTNTNKLNNSMNLRNNNY